MLLDVNVLVALAWPNHQFHGAARRWFGQQAAPAWHTCAITQLGFVRLSSNPAFSEEPRTPSEAAELLGQLCAHPGHAYLEAHPAPASSVKPWRRVHGHKQTTDAYLVLVARHHGVKLATFDQRIRSNPDLAGDVHVIAP